MKIEELCFKIISEFYVNVDTITRTEKIHFSLGVLLLAKKLDPHNKNIDSMLKATNDEIEKLNAKADFLEYFYRLLDEMSNGNADSVGSMHIELEGPKTNDRHEFITIDYKSEFVEE